MPANWLSQRAACAVALAAALVLAPMAGCGINKSRLATEQLVVSEAVDRAVATIDFSPLSGQKIYFDTQYIDGTPMGANANLKYTISSLRQQMIAYDLRLQEKADTADFIVEGRVGVLANDGYEVTYGIPGSAAAASATVMLASPYAIPAAGMPELSLGRRNHQAGAAKIGLFAYDRHTREPVWQAGIKKGSSNIRDTWLMGLGPYQTRPPRPRRWWWKTQDPAEMGEDGQPLAAYNSTIVFERAVRPASPHWMPPNGSEVAPANNQQAISGPPILQPAGDPPHQPPGTPLPLRPPQ